jgi:hypothetical protein
MLLTACSLYCNGLEKTTVNFEILIRQYLYQNKSIALPGMGRLYFGASAQLPATTSDKYEAVPLQDLNFEYDLQQQSEPEFIKFVSTHTGKIAPLASSDVESHFMLCKQFINIGKAYIIDGVGTIEKKDDGTYGFTPGTYIPVSDAITVTHKPLKVREPQPVIPRDTAPRGKQVNYKNIFLIIGIVLLIGVAGWAAWYFFVKNRITDNTVLTTPSADSTTTSDSSNRATPMNGSTAQAPATVTNSSADPNGYRAIYEVTNDKARAIKRTKMLADGGNDARYEAIDSSRWKMYIYLNSLPSDTARKRDSLSKFLAKRVRLEKI